MKENEFIRKVIGEKILNRESIRDHAICAAEAKLRLPHGRSWGSAKPAGNGRHANGVQGVMGDAEKDKKKRDTRRLVLATNLVLAVVLSGLILFTATGLIRIPGLPAWGNNPTTTAVTTTAETTHAALPAEEPADSKADDIISAFQKNLWEYEGGSTSLYPEYYAGAYFEKETSLQGFTVLVTCEPSTVGEKLTQVAQSTFSSFLLPMNIVRAERSYNQLLRQYDAVSRILNGKQDNLSDADKTVLSRIDKVGIDEKNNEVYIEVKKGTGEEVETLYRAMLSLEGYDFVNAKIRVYAVTEETQPTVPTVNASDVFHDFLTQKNFKLRMNSVASADLHLPDNFTAVIDGYSIGEFLQQRNMLSKQNNLDFSSFMGKDVGMYIADIETGGNTGIVGFTGYGIVTFVADGKVVAYWAESGIEDPVLNGYDYQVLIWILQKDGYKK